MKIQEQLQAIITRFRQSRKSGYTRLMAGVMKMREDVLLVTRMQSHAEHIAKRNLLGNRVVAIDQLHTRTEPMITVLDNDMIMDLCLRAAERINELEERNKTLERLHIVSPKKLGITNVGRFFNEDNHQKIMHEFLSHEELINTCMSDSDFIASIQRAADIMIASLKNGGKIIACGNGGSMSDAMHFCAELTGRLKESRAPIPAIAISDPAHLSCVANDFGYDQVFARFVTGVGNKGDALLAITTSGNSENIQEAVRAAYHRGLNIVLLTGNGGGIMKSWGYGVNHVLVPGEGLTSANIQQIHIIVIHILCGLIEKALSPHKP